MPFDPPTFPLIYLLDVLANINGNDVGSISVSPLLLFDLLRRDIFLFRWEGFEFPNRSLFPAADPILYVKV